MRITVIAVDQSEVSLVRGTSALGWRGQFGCPLVVGDAVFIAARGREANLRAGNSLAVETGYESVAGVKIVPTAENMRPLDNPGDYLICGRVVHVAPQGIVRVSVRGLIFNLERAELHGLQPQVGDGLEFLLQGLSLWDTGG
jgi:hypothetical protein